MASQLGQMCATTGRVITDPARVLDTGHGTGIDTHTLMGLIHDDAAFDSWCQESDDPVLPVIGALFRGHPDAAQRALEDAIGAATESSRFRLRALQADIHRDLANFDAAEAIYRQLLHEETGTSREAVLHQHLGKTYFVAGKYQRAHDCFAEALRLREATETPSDQLQSSQVALARAADQLQAAER